MSFMKQYDSNNVESVKICRKHFGNSVEVESK